MIHEEQYPLSGTAVTVRLEGHAQLDDGAYPYVVEDWWDRVYGRSWMDSDGNPAAMLYAMRAGLIGLPLDNDVVYGKIDGIGFLVHTSELKVEDDDVHV